LIGFRARHLCNAPVRTCHFDSPARITITTVFQDRSPNGPRSLRVLDALRFPGLCSLCSLLVLGRWCATAFCATFPTLSASRTPISHLTSLCSIRAHFAFAAGSQFAPLICKTSPLQKWRIAPPPGLSFGNINSGAGQFFHPALAHTGLARPPGNSCKPSGLCPPRGHRTWLSPRPPRLDRAMRISVRRPRPGLREKASPSSATFPGDVLGNDPRDAGPPGPAVGAAQSTEHPSRSLFCWTKPSSPRSLKRSRSLPHYVDM